MNVLRDETYFKKGEMKMLENFDVWIIYKILRKLIFKADRI